MLLESVYLGKRSSRESCEHTSFTNNSMSSIAKKSSGEKDRSSLFAWTRIDIEDTMVSCLSEMHQGTNRPRVMDDIMPRVSSHGSNDVSSSTWVTSARRSSIFSNPTQTPCISEERSPAEMVLCTSDEPPTTSSTAARLEAKHPRRNSGHARPTCGIAAPPVSRCENRERRGSHVALDVVHKMSDQQDDSLGPRCRSQQIIHSLSLDLFIPRRGSLSPIAASPPSMKCGEHALPDWLEISNLVNDSCQAHKANVDSRISTPDSSPSRLPSSSPDMQPMWGRLPSEHGVFADIAGTRRNSTEYSFNNLEWPDVDDAEFARGKALLQTLELDALSFSSDTLLHLALEIFMEELQLDGQLRIPVVKFQRFLLSVRERMLDNPYHNFHHVFDVLQTTLALGLKSGLIASLSTMERFALGVAALCHDLEHPGINNSALSMLKRTNEDDNLEKHHSRLAFQIMVLEEVDLLKGFSTSKYYAFRDCVFKLILATDMSRHEEYMQRVAGLTDGKTADKQLAMELLMKCSDVSNVIKPFPIAKKWAVRITDEFFAQGDMERERGLSVTPTCDRFLKTRVELQKGFYDYVAQPFFDAMERSCPDLHESFAYLRMNRSEWEWYTDEMLMAEVCEDW